MTKDEALARLRGLSKDGSLSEDPEADHMAADLYYVSF